MEDYPFFLGTSFYVSYPLSKNEGKVASQVEAVLGGHYTLTLNTNKIGTNKDFSQLEASIGFQINLP